MPIASSKHRARPWRVFALAFAGLLPFVSQAEEDVFFASVTARERYDSNLFRLPDGVDPFIDGRRSATTQTYGLGLVAAKSYGLQHFDLTATVTRDQYQPYHYLDATGRTLSASWNWSLTPSITGTLSINQTEAPNNFADTGFQTQTNLRKTEQRRFETNWLSGASVHPRISLLQDEDKSDQTTFERQNVKTTSVESAIVYDFRSGNSADLYFRRGRGNYTDLGADPTLAYDSQFDENEVGTHMHWGLSGITSVDGRIGYLDRKHRTFAERNFEGVVGRVTGAYSLTGKIQLLVNASRTLSSIQSFTSSFSRDDTISIGPVWNVTPKIAVRPAYAITYRTFRGAIVPVAANLDMTLRDATLQVDWSVLRALDLSLQFSKSTRNSNDRTYQFNNHGAFALASYRF